MSLCQSLLLKESRFLHIGVGGIQCPMLLQYIIQKVKFLTENFEAGKEIMMYTPGMGWADCDRYCLWEGTGTGWRDKDFKERLTNMLRESKEMCLKQLGRSAGNGDSQVENVTLACKSLPKSSPCSSMVDLSWQKKESENLKTDILWSKNRD